VPPGTGLRFQLRTADGVWNLLSEQFSGPGGPGSYYAEESPISFEHSGDRWVQYMAYLNTSDITQTPALTEVRITYNRFPGAPAGILPINESWTNTSHPVFSWQLNDTDSPSQGCFEWQIGLSPDPGSMRYTSGEMSTNDTYYYSEDSLDEGLWYWRVRTQDIDGDWGPFCDFRKLGVDITAPAAFTPQASPGDWTNGRCEVGFFTSDSLSGLAGYQLWLDGKPAGPVESPFLVPLNVSDGAHSILIRAYDMAGNYAEGRTKAFIDRTPPDPFTPTATPSSWTKQGPRMDFSAKDNVSGIDHYELKVDQGPFERRTSPYVLPELEDGTHEVIVRAFDRAGNCRDGNLSVFVDRTEPEPLDLSVEPAGWTNRDLAVTFETTDRTSDIDHYELDVDSHGYTVQSSPYRLPSLADGMHTVTVRAYDLAGNFVERWITAYVDRTPPENFTPATNPESWTRLDPVVSFATEDAISSVVTYQGKIDDGAFEKVRSPWHLEGLSDGTHNVTVRASDGAGNSVDGTVAVWTDRSAPEVSSFSINNGSRTVQGQKVRLGISAADSCDGLDGMCFSNDGLVYSAWENYSQLKNWTLAPGVGDKTVYLKVRDRAGNEARPVSATILYEQAARPDYSMVAPAVILIVIIAVCAFVAVRRRRRKSR
jgi:hypothetical protein